MYITYIYVYEKNFIKYSKQEQNKSHLEFHLEITIINILVYNLRFYNIYKYIEREIEI